MRLIDADALKAVFQLGNMCNEDCSRNPDVCCKETVSYMDLCCFIDNMQTQKAGESDEHA